MCARTAGYTAPAFGAESDQYTCPGWERRTGRSFSDLCGQKHLVDYRATVLLITPLSQDENIRWERNDLT